MFHNEVFLNSSQPLHIPVCVVRLKLKCTCEVKVGGTRSVLCVSALCWNGFKFIVSQLHKDGF